MITPTQQQILAALTEMMEAHPDWRFGQMVENISMWAKGPEPSASWDVEDDEFLQSIRSHLQQLQARLAATECDP
jgi:hypothetical protein